MARPKKDEEREERIQMEIIVDAYEAEEQVLARIGTIGSSKDISFNDIQ